MADEFAPLNLRARLATLQDRIMEARAQLEAQGLRGDPLETLNDLFDTHNSIRGSLESNGTITELQHSKASAQTDALEAALDKWLQGVEHQFNYPVRNPSASV